MNADKRRLGRMRLLKEMMDVVELVNARPAWISVKARPLFAVAPCDSECRVGFGTRSRRHFQCGKRVCREPMCRDGSKPKIVERETFRIDFQAQQRFRHSGKKFIAQSSATLLIPIVCLAQYPPGRH